MSGNQIQRVWFMVTMMFLVTVVLVGIYVWAIVSDPEAFWPYTGFYAALLLLWVHASVYRVHEADGLEAYIMDEHWCTYLSASFESMSLRMLPQRARDKYWRLVNDGSLNPGGHWAGYVFLPAGFFRVFRFPTVGTTLFLHAGKIYTKSSSKQAGAAISRVLMAADPTFTLHFITIRGVVSTFSMPKGRYVDLTTRCKVGEGTHEYDDFWIAKVIMDEMTELFMEATRTAAAHFRFDDPENDIIERKPDVEMTLLYILAEPGSRLQKASILERPTNPTTGEAFSYDICRTLFDNGEGSYVKLDSFNGPDIVANDINLEGISFDKQATEAPDAEKAVNAAYIGMQEGLRDGNKEAKIGEGRAAAFKAMRNEDALGDPALAAFVKATEGKETHFNLFGKGIIDAIAKVFTN